jgi:HSP20 family molecular chaperone IbpA
LNSESLTADRVVLITIDVAGVDDDDVDVRAGNWEARRKCKVMEMAPTIR